MTYSWNEVVLDRAVMEPGVSEGGSFAIVFFLLLGMQTSCILHTDPSLTAMRTVVAVCRIECASLIASCRWFVMPTMSPCRPVRQPSLCPTRPSARRLVPGG